MDSAMASRSGLPWVAISCSADRRWARGRDCIQEHGNRVFSLGHEQEGDGVTWKTGGCAIEERFLHYADRRVRRKRTRKKKVGLLRSE
jgi:hypothetical protein